eukprot:2360320-Pyramimonas_sp.AAC.1
MEGGWFSTHGSRLTAAYIRCSRFAALERMGGFRLLLSPQRRAHASYKLGALVGIVGGFFSIFGFRWRLRQVCTPGNWGDTAAAWIQGGFFPESS